MRPTSTVEKGNVDLSAIMALDDDRLRNLVHS